LKEKSTKPKKKKDVILNETENFDGKDFKVLKDNERNERQ